MRPLEYCWGSVFSAFFNALAQFIYFTGKILLTTPCLVNRSDILRPLLSSHLWHVLEELTTSAYLFHFMVVVWFFASRDQNTIITMPYVIEVSISACFMSYICAVPFYLLVERPFRNFLDLILFPRATIFKRSKDVDDEESS